MKAVVLETRGKEAAVLVRDGTVRIALGSYNVGDIIDYREARRSLLRYWAAAAAAMIVAIGITTGLWVDRNYITYAEVSLDVNPSIVYSLNKRDRVLSMRAANEGAEAIVEQLSQDSIRFAPLSEAVEKTMGVLEGEGYLSEDTEDYVLINVSADDEARQDRLVDEVEGAMTQTMEQDSTLEYHIDRSDRHTAREARKSGVSTGRYVAWQEAGREERGSGEPSIEDYATKPVREIMGKGSPAQDGQDASEQDDHVPGGQAPGGQVPGGSVPDSHAPDGQAPSDTAPNGQAPDNNTTNGQPPGTDEGTPPSDADNPGSGTESAGAPNPPAGASPQANELQRPQENDSQPPEDRSAQHPEDSAAQRPEDNPAADSGDRVTQPEEADVKGSASKRNDAKDSPADQNESSNAPGANADDGNDTRQDRSGDSGTPPEKSDRDNDKKQSSPSGSADEKKQTSTGNPDGGKKQTPNGNSDGSKKSGSSGGKRQDSPGGNGKSDPGHK